MLKNYLTILALLASVYTSAGKSHSIPKWGVLDIPFQVKKIPQSPFDITFAAKFRHESGKEMVVPGFYNDGKEYVVRASFEEKGKWTYITHSSLRELSGLTGEVSVTANTKPDEHGPVVISKDNHQQFAYADGTPYFLLAFELDWLFALDWNNQTGIPKTEKIIGDVAANGFNQIVMNVYAYDASWGDRESIDQGNNYAEPKVFPFGGTNENPDHSTLNIDFFKHLDRVITHLDDKEIISHLMIYVWNKKVNWPEPKSLEDNRYFDYVVKRYQAYPNLIWDISKEALAYGRDDMGYITNRIERLQALDGHDRLVSVHDYSYCNAFPEMVDFISIQEWSPNLYDKMSRVKSKHSKKPIFNIEHGGYEKSMHSIFDGSYTDPVVCLDRNYQCIFAGTYSTYYWQNTSWYEVVSEPFKLPKEKQPYFVYFKHLTDLFRKYDFNKLNPNQRAFTSYFLTDDESLFLFYVPPGSIANSGDVRELKGKKTKITWFDPLTGNYIDEGERVFEGNWVSLRKPESLGNAMAVAILEVVK